MSSHRTRVLVVAADRLARAGLAALLTDASPGWPESPEPPEVSVVGRATEPADLEPAIAAHAPEVIVLDAGPAPDPAATRELVAESVEHAEPLPVLVLVDGEDAARTALGAGAHGALPRDVDGGPLAAAVVALRHGLRVLHPELAVYGVAAQSEGPVEPLTPREHEVLALLAEGRSNRQIAAALTISPHTVKDHVDAILTKLGAASRTEAAIRAARLGLVAL